VRKLRSFNKQEESMVFKKASEPLEGEPVVSRLPELSSPVILKNLWYEIERLKLAPSWQLPTGRSSETLAKYPDFVLVLVLMKAETLMEKHEVAGRISLYIIEGRIEVHLQEGQVIPLGAGELLTLDHGLAHDVQALKDSAFLLTVVGSAGSV
jgi:quercetin dioxygenase-like cupin family protein